MSVHVRIRNGLAPSGGSGGATEGDLRGDYSDIISSAGVVDVTGGHLLVHEKGTPDMNVIVDAGVGYIPNTSFDETDSDSVRFWEAVVAGTELSRTLSIGANSSGQTRIDIICLKIDTGEIPDPTASDVATLIRVAGTPGSGVPATPSFHLKLAEVTVVNGATEIEDADIADSRVQISIRDAVLPTTLTDKDLIDPKITKAINTQTDSYTLVLTDGSKLIQMNKGSANNLTVPPNSSVAFPIGTVIGIIQIGAGQTTIVAGSGVTINVHTDLTLLMNGQHSIAVLIKTATNTWQLAGDLEAS